MSQKFNVKVNDSNTFEIDSDAIKSLDAIKTKKNAFHLLDNNKPYTIEITESDFLSKTYSLKVNNNTYSIKIEDELD
ncbi:MAG: acetyl-CoA carboxylase biotin carboxyl carrier protein subunit, partial [Olleya sp.]